MFKVTAPSRWVLARAIAAHLRPIEDALDPAAYPGRRLNFALPQWLDHLHYQLRVDGVYWQITDHRIHMLGKAVFPLPPVHRAAPAGLMARDERISAFLERHRGCPCNTLRCQFRMASFDWIDAIN